MESGKDKDKRNNLKQSLEQQKQQNKQKFQDPFYIKIGGSGAGNGDDDGDASNLKIVKQRRREEDDDNITDQNESDSMVDDGSGYMKKDAKGRSGSANNRKGSIQLRRNTNQTVLEAREEEESSPKLPKGKYSPTRNNDDKIKAGIKGKQPNHKMSNMLSDVDKFEKISDDGQSTAAKTLPQLVKLDVNLDTLKNFLEDIQEAINDHAKSINVIQTDLKKKANERTVSHYFLKISEGLHKECGERPHAFRLDNEQHNFLSDNFQTDDSVQLKRQAEKLQEKLEIIGLNLINLTKFRNNTDERVEKLERIIPKCFTIDQFREESQQLETRTMKYIDDRLGLFQENLNNYKKELNEALTFFDKKVNDNQSATLWRIKDCEELLRSRVSDKYVNDAVKAIEEKLTKQITYTDERNLERLEKSFKELGTRVVTTNQFFQEKFDDLRKIISAYDTKIQNMATNDKLASVQTGYRDMKYNFEREMEMLQEHVKETKDKIGELNKRFSNLEIATTTLANGGDFNYQMIGGGNNNMAHHPSNQITSRNQFQNQQISDKQQKSQTSMKKSPSSKDKHEQVQHQIQANSPGSNNFSPIAKKRMNRAADAAFSAEMEKRITAFETQFENIDSKFESLKKQLDDKITKDDVRKLTSDKISKEDLEHIIPNEEITQEKLRYLVKEEIETLTVKISEQFKQFDNKMIRLRAELDIHSIHRQLERKANEEQVRNDFGNHEFKIGTLDRNIIRMATDFETFQQAINKMHTAIIELQDANRDVLLGKKTTNCLSCGKGGDTGQTVKGKDGRMYKAADQGHVKLHQDDSAILPSSHYQLYDAQSPLTVGQNNIHQISINQYGTDANNQDFFKMRQSNSFYDSGLGGGGNAYDPTVASAGHHNLPSVHNKKNSYGGLNGGNSNLIKGMASHAGLNTSAVLNGQSSTSLNPVGNTSFHQTTKKKLPFGFQVQQEKKELFKIGIQQNGQSRGKSSQNAKRAQSNRGYEMNMMGGYSGGRPDSAKHQENAYNLNSTFEQNL